MNYLMLNILKEMFNKNFLPASAKTSFLVLLFITTIGYYFLHQYTNKMCVNKVFSIKVCIRFLQLKRFNIIIIDKHSTFKHFIKLLTGFVICVNDNIIFDQIFISSFHHPIPTIIILENNHSIYISSISVINRSLRTCR